MSSSASVLCGPDPQPIWFLSILHGSTSLLQALLGGLLLSALGLRLTYDFILWTGDTLKEVPRGYSGVWSHKV